MYSTIHSARNLGFILTNFSLSLIKYAHYSNPAILIFVNFAAACVRLYLDFKAANTIAASTVHSKLDYCNSVTVLQPILFSVKQTSTNPEQSCLCCC